MIEEQGQGEERRETERGGGRSTIKKGILEDIGPLLLVLVLLLDPVLAEFGRQVDGVLAVPALPLQAELVPPEPERGRPAGRGRGCCRRQRGGPATLVAVLLVLVLVLVLVLL